MSPVAPSAPAVLSPDRWHRSRANTPEETARLIKLIVQDLNAGNESPVDVLRTYERAVGDHDRRRRAARTLEDAGRGRLRSEGDLSGLIEVLYFSSRQPLLSKHHLLFPAYRIHEDYFLNAVNPSGPLAPSRPRASHRHWMFLGKKIGFPIGVPASPLTANAQWVHYLAQNGFNILTYKTIRSRAHEPHPPPNWIFLPHITEPFEVGLDIPQISAEKDAWFDLGTPCVSTANSFGVPSADPRFWEADLEESFNVLHDDQVLIVSVMGDDYDRTGKDTAIADDYASLAVRAESAGAEFVELNLSCPNSLVPGEGVKPPLCQDIDLTRRVVETVRDRTDQSTKIIAKLSYLPLDGLRNLVQAIGSSVDAISGINTLQSRVSDRDGRPVFPGRSLAGVSGVSIRNHSREFVANLARLRIETGLRFEIIGMGGVTDVSSFRVLYDAGAGAVQSASGVFANPFLAWDCVDQLRNTLPLSPELPDPLRNEAKAKLMEVVASAHSMDRYTVASKTPLPPSQSLRLLDEMAQTGEVEGIATRSGFLYRVGRRKK